MSKQFDELYEQAVTIASGELSVWNENWTPKSPKFKYEEVLFKKFGELVVRECARVSIQKQTENDIAGTVSKNPGKDFAYALIKHFGIEE